MNEIFLYIFIGVTVWFFIECDDIKVGEQNKKDECPLPLLILVGSFIIAVWPLVLLCFVIDKLFATLVAVFGLTACHDIPGLTKTKEVVSQVAVDKAEFYHDLYELQYMQPEAKSKSYETSSRDYYNVINQEKDSEKKKALQETFNKATKAHNLVNSILESDAYTDIVQQLLELDEARGYDKADDLCKAQDEYKKIIPSDLIKLVHEAEELIKKLS